MGRKTTRKEKREEYKKILIAAVEMLERRYIELKKVMDDERTQDKLVIKEYYKPREEGENE